MHWNQQTQNARGPPWRRVFAPGPWRPCSQGVLRLLGRGAGRATGCHVLHFLCGHRGLGQGQERNECCRVWVTAEQWWQEKKNRWVGGEWTWPDRKRLSENVEEPQGERRGNLLWRKSFTLIRVVSRRCSLNGRTQHGLQHFRLWGHVTQHGVLDSAHFRDQHI